MVAIVFDYRNLFDILKSIDFVENCVWLPLCLGLRMHEECQGVYRRGLNWGI